MQIPRFWSASLGEASIAYFLSLWHEERERRVGPFTERELISLNPTYFGVRSPRQLLELSS